MKSRGWLAIAGAVMMLAGGLLAYFTQTSGGIRIEDVRFAGEKGNTMSALVYVPPTATEQHPAPGILAVHGYLNSREAQGDFAVEFARRGYVVVALDQAGHGYSDPPAFGYDFGGPDGLRYLRSLPFVDKDNIGLEGHSMGGWTVLAAAAAMPDAYKAVVLEGSSTGAPFAKEGDPSWPRNLAVVFSKYDEFAGIMWGSPKPTALPTTPKIKAVFGVQEPIEIGKVYGDVGQGAARILQQPAVTHPGDHISHEAIGYALDWFGKTLVGGTPLPADDQIWLRKELGTGAALVGFVVFLLGIFDLLLSLPVFAGLRSDVTGAAVAESQPARRIMAAFWITVLIPPLTYYPAFMLGDAFLPASVLFPQTFTSQVMVWAVINLVIALALLRLAPRSFERTGIMVRSLFIALAVVAIGYAVVWLADAVLKIDLRFWFFALKLPSAAQFRAFLSYILPFTAFFVVSLHMLHRNFSAPSTPRVRHYAITVLSLVLGFVILEAVQYGHLWLTGELINPIAYNPALVPLSTIIGINFLPVFVAVGFISTFTWRRTGSSLPGALICSLLVTWYLTVGTATHFA